MYQISDGELNLLVMKRHAFWIFVLLIGLAWLLLSCEEHENCETPATVVQLPEGCGYGFELSNGKLLKPTNVYGCFTLPDNPLYNLQNIAGQKVLIGFVKSNYDDDCGRAKAVNITCLQTLDVVGM